MRKSSSESLLRVSARLEGDMILVEIWDSGPGIRPEHQDRIFEPFFTTKPPGQGLGLGLDNAMRIVRKHRGHMDVHSKPGSRAFAYICRSTSCRRTDLPLPTRCGLAFSYQLLAEFARG